MDERARRCRSRSRYGRCSRPGKHNGPHAVWIGDSTYYGYRPGGIALGYGYLDGDEFAYTRPVASTQDTGDRHA